MSRLFSMEAYSMRDSKASGYTKVGSWMIFVWDGARFRKHIATKLRPNELCDWADTFDPPMACYNGYLWVYSPGPIPRLARYSP